MADQECPRPGVRLNEAEREHAVRLSTAHRDGRISLGGMRGAARLVVPRGGSAGLTRLRGSGRLARTDVPVEPGTGGVHLTVWGLVAVRGEVEVHHPGVRRPWWSRRLSR